MVLKPISKVSKEVKFNKLGKLIDLFLENSNRVPELERIYYKWEDIPSAYKTQVTIVNYKIGFDQYDFHKIAFNFHFRNIVEDEEDRLAELFPTESYITVALPLYSYQGQRIENQLNKLKFLRKKYDYRILLISIPNSTSKFGFGENQFLIDEFGFDESHLTAEHISKLSFFSKYIKRTYRQSSSEKYRPVKKITIHGATDLVGSDDYNFALGEKRSLAVKKYLKNKIEYATIDAVRTIGEKAPEVKTDEPEGKNRFVVIELTYHLPVLLATKDIQKIILNILEQNKEKLNQVYYKQFRTFVTSISDDIKDDKYLTYSDIQKASQFRIRIPKSNNMKHLRQVLLFFYYKNKPTDLKLYEFTQRLFETIEKFVDEAIKLEAKQVEDLIPGSRKKIYHLNKWEMEIVLFYDLRVKQKYNYPSIFECFRA